MTPMHLFCTWFMFLPRLIRSNTQIAGKCENIVPTWYWDQGHQTCAHFLIGGDHVCQSCKHNTAACSHNSDGYSHASFSQDFFPKLFTFSNCHFPAYFYIYRWYFMFWHVINKFDDTFLLIKHTTSNQVPSAVLICSYIFVNRIDPS